MPSPHKIPNEKLIAAVKQASSFEELLSILGLESKGKTSTFGVQKGRLKERIVSLGLNTSHFSIKIDLSRERCPSQVLEVTDEQFAELIQTSTSISQVAKSLQYRSGWAYPAIKKRIAQLNLDTSHFTGQTWNKGKTKETSASLKQSGETFKSRGYKPWLGRKHKKETREKISKAARGWSNGLVKTKWFAVDNPSLGHEVSVQGTWEKSFAEWLNQNEIRWEKTRERSLSWTISGDDIQRTYYPDFYLPDADLFIEIKGYMWKSTRTGVDDERKLQLVQEQNPNVKLVVLMKEELRSLGLNVK